MCGICGYLRKELIPNELLREMNDTMYHRGPNDCGTWQLQKDSYGIGLAQRRLSILDLSELGHQPMLSEDGKKVISYNGEIYNFVELREELVKRGYHFKSNCDTEVILNAYQEWGCECFKKFNGMFAIAIYDEVKDTIILARDRIGKKPLYYFVKDNEFAFASELKPIMKYPFFDKKINADVIGHFMCNKYILAPKTIFENTYKVEPGTYIIYEKGSITRHRYWDLLEVKRCKVEKLNDFNEAKRELRELLRDSISKRMVADVPVGVFLSGGIDSTLITAISKEVSCEPVDSFSIGFYDKVRNEAPYAAQIAKHIGTKHHELYMSEEQILEMLQGLPQYFDEPFSDSSQLPTMLVSKMASQDVTVALAGDGGDEVFCGYKMYDWTWIAEHFDFLGKIESMMPWNKAVIQHMPVELRAFINNRDENFKSQLYIDVMIEEAQKLLIPDVKDVKFDIEKHIVSDNLQEKRMLLDMLTYLPDEILSKTDRASMKYSLEVRCPLLDYRIIEWSFGIPHSFKYHNFEKKYLLKELTYEYVPKQLLDRPKNGFGVPLRKWLRTILKPEIMRFAEPEKLKKQGVFDTEAVAQLIRKQEISDKIMYSSLLWSFYVFQKWYQMYIEDLWC